MRHDETVSSRRWWTGVTLINSVVDHAPWLSRFAAAALTLRRSRHALRIVRLFATTKLTSARRAHRHGRKWFGGAAGFERFMTACDGRSFCPGRRGRTVLMQRDFPPRSPEVPKVFIPRLDTGPLSRRVIERACRHNESSGLRGRESRGLHTPRPIRPQLYFHGSSAPARRPSLVNELVSFDG